VISTSSRPARASLRTEIVVVTVVLMVVGLGIAGALAVTELRGYLLARVDDQLRAAAHPVTDRPDAFQPPGDGGGSGPGDGPGAPSPFAISYVDVSGSVTAVVHNPLASGTDAPQLPTWTLDQVRASHGAPFTVGSRSGGSSWRVIALPRADGLGSVMVAQSLQPMQSTVRRLALTEAAAGLLLLALLAVASSLLVRRSLRPLRTVEQTAGALADGDLTQRVPEADPRTEVGQLASSFNRMADRIETAFAQRAASEAAARESERRMRQFAADASHELRTPLTSIRGYAELYEQGAISDEADLHRAMGRIEEQATRMGVLVDDLLLLARMDQQRPLDQAPVDLVALVLDAVGDARSSQPQRRVEVQVDVPAGRLVVIGDEVGLRQVVSNLLANALRYTPIDTPVTVRVSVDHAVAGASSAGSSGWAVVEVTDRGPGLSPTDAARIFERFYRTDTARSRDVGGTGLGLAIVDAMVRAHGGHVGVITAPGAGSTFRAALPLPAPPGNRDGGPSTGSP
jgi:two-component system, OmpR family, sensor kinase